MIDSYSSSVSAARCSSSAIWTSDSCSGAGSERSVSVVTTCPPLTATTSPAAIASTATMPLPSMSLSTPLRALGVIQDAGGDVIRRSPAGRQTAHGRSLLWNIRGNCSVVSPPPRS